MLLTVLAILTALFHIYAFFLESILWGGAKANRIFRMTPESAANGKLIAFNQGFYNLFLAIAIALGFWFLHQGDDVRGRLLIDYAMASAFGAGLVLVYSSPKLFRAALGQALPSVIYFAARCL